ncbi:MAG: hypothetical protein ACI9SJ_001013 [Flavobacteriaceae bacterium]|jgi:hypothetical protein|uniref:T9SS type A sorting domain-containing protein n=1 Tax=Candidatus Marifrigoribacter sp. Uisw_064 TaxID=3230970 RepID=UPI003AED3BBA
MKNINLFILGLITTISYAQFGPEQIVTIEAIGAKSVFAADLDGDDDMDVLSASEGDEKVAWYENMDGLGTFGPQQVISIGVEGARKIFATDLDGDDDIDVLATEGSGDKVIWFENLDGLGNFSAKKIITTLVDAPLSVIAADLDGDDDMDVLSASAFDSKIAWYENTDGLGTFGPQQIISGITSSVRDVHAADLDDDGDMDVIAADTAADQVIWFENIDGLGTFGTAQIINDNTNGVISIYSADFDGDDNMDVLASSFPDDKIAWFENVDGQGAFGTEKIINNNVDAIRDGIAVDLDNDGDIDVLSASAEDDKVAWYENLDGLGNFGSQQIISTEADGANTVFAADLDGDGDMDVLSSSLVDYKIAWYENLTLIGIDEFSHELITILPNPVSTILYVDNTSTTQIKTIKIYDVLGRLVFQEREQFNTIDVSHLTSGLLFVKIETAKGIVTKKVVKE